MPRWGLPAVLCRQTFSLILEAQVTSLSSPLSKLRTLQFSHVKFFFCQKVFDRFREGLNNLGDFIQICWNFLALLGWSHHPIQLGLVETSIFQPVFGKIATMNLYGKIAMIYWFNHQLSVTFKCSKWWIHHFQLLIFFLPTNLGYFYGIQSWRRYYSTLWVLQPPTNLAH